MILFKLNEVKNSQSKYQYFNKFAYLWPFNRHLLARECLKLMHIVSSN